MSKIARISYRFLAVTVSSVLTLCCCEAFLRYTMPFSVPLGIPSIAGRAAIADHPVRYRFSYNRRGFRTGEFSDHPASGVTRIVVCGDSHAFGWGVDDGKRLTDHLLHELAGKLPGPVEVLNLAQPGASFPDYVLCAENASALGASALIVVVYAGNDFGETVARGVPRKESSLRPNAPLQGREFLRTFYLWQLPLRAFAYFSKPSEFLEGEGGCQARVPWVDWGPFWQALFQACILCNNQKLESAKAAAAIATERVVTSAGCPVLIALLPSRLMTHQTDAIEQANRVGGNLGVNAANAASLEAELTHNFLEITGKRTRYVINLTSTIADLQNAYFPIDWHLSERGHKVVGEALAAKVIVVLEEK